jgi:hypothetical protein
MPGVEQNDIGTWRIPLDFEVEYSLKVAEEGACPLIVVLANTSTHFDIFTSCLPT